MIREERYLPSCNKLNRLHLLLWKPEGEVKAILQISHGMAEHVERYEELAQRLCRDGILVAAADHLGHGHSVRSAKELGYFRAAQGRSAADTVLADLHRVSALVKREYPGLPFFLLGHSMGSFFARAYLNAYGKELDGVLLLGTGGGSLPALYAGKLLVACMSFLQGEHYRSALVADMLNHSYLGRIKEPKTPSDWLSKVEERVKAYCGDPLCSFPFSWNGYGVLVDIMMRNAKEERYPAEGLKDLPVCFLSGEEDPVGSYGKTVRQLFRNYKKRGFHHVDMRLYSQDRHELLNETDREKVMEDIAELLQEWCKSRTREKK